jgi:hypothetical protein
MIEQWIYMRMNERKKEYFRSFSVPTKTGTSEVFASLSFGIIGSTIGKKIRSNTLSSVLRMEDPE